MRSSKTSRRREPDLSVVHFRATSLRIAVEELQKAVKWRDISLKANDDRLRQAARSGMRQAAINSRTSYAGGLIYA